MTVRPLIVLLLTTSLFFFISLTAIDKMFVTLEYMVHGDFLQDFCDYPWSYERLVFESGANLATPYETCGPLCELENRYMCTVTTRDIEDLKLTGDMERGQQAEVVRTHGTAVIPSVLKPETAAALRKAMYEQSSQDWADGKQIDVEVFEASNRWHGMPHLESPALRRALREIGEHPIVRPLLEDILSPKASVVSISVIRSDYGAAVQHWHTDTGHLKTHWGFNQDVVFDFLTLGVVLQDTTSRMGATGVCPGMFDGAIHYEMEDNGMMTCYHPSIDGDFVGKDGLRYETGDVEDMCMTMAPLDVGDAVLFKGDITHRGGGHTDRRPGAERFVLFLEFVESRNGSDDKRMLMGNENVVVVYSLRLPFWGLDISTFKYMDLPLGLWRVTHSVVVGWAFLRRIGTGIGLWETDGYLAITAIDNACLLWRGSRWDALGAGGAREGFYLRDFEAIVESLNASRKVIESLVFVSTLLNAAACVALWLLTIFPWNVLGRVASSESRKKKNKND